jgi:hypothetical protein
MSNPPRGLEAKERELAALVSGRLAIKLEQDILQRQKALELGHTELAEARKQLAVKLEPLDREHALRRLFLCDPEAAEFVRSDLEWLRLVLLVYGGLKGVELADYVIQYSEIARVLQLGDDMRERFVEQLRTKPYWRESWSGGDTIYNLAVYLDTECGPGAKAASKAALTFEPSYICLDSPLTPILLQSLQERVPGRQLLDPMLELAKRHDDPVRSASAWLALLALDPTRVFDDLLSLARDGARLSTVKALRNLIEQRLVLLRCGTVLYSASKGLGVGFAEATPLPNDRFEDMISVFYRAMCDTPAAVPDPRWLTAHMDLPYANAELWAVWMSASGDDAKYNFAAVLDTLGAKIHSADALANLHRTHTARLQGPTAWTLDPIPPVWESLPDQCGEAFTIAQGSSSLVLEDLFHRGTISFAGVDFKESPDLLSEAIATALLFPV